MAINVSAANALADQLRSYETQLAQAKNSLREYQSAISANWQANETGYINQAIERAIVDINNVQNQLNPLSIDIRNAAEQIRCEEEAAAALARKQEQIRKARANLDTAKLEADDQKKKLDKLVRNLNKKKTLTAADKAALKAAQTTYIDAIHIVERLQNQLNQLIR